MGQLRGLMYFGFIVAVVAGWVITRYRDKQVKTKRLSDFTEIPNPSAEDGIQHSNWKIRLQSLEVLLEDRTSNMLDILLDFLGDPVSDLRLLAISEVATYGNAALGGLAQILATEDLTARESAIHTLLAIGTPQTVPTLIHSLIFDESAWVRAPAANGLGTIGGKEATEALILALKDTHPDVNEAVREALKQIGTPKALEAIKS